MTTFYRATLILERVEPDEHDDLGERRTEIGAHTVTGDTPADAMVQMCAHADSLYEWHVTQQEKADDELAPDDEAVSFVPLGDDHPITQAFRRVFEPLNRFHAAAEPEDHAHPFAPMPASSIGSCAVCSRPRSHSNHDGKDEPADDAEPGQEGTDKRGPHCMTRTAVGWCYRPVNHAGLCDSGLDDEAAHAGAEDIENNALLNAEADARDAAEAAEVRGGLLCVPGCTNNPETCEDHPF